MSTPYPRDLIGYGGNPPHPHWPGEARIAVNFVMRTPSAQRRTGAGRALLNHIIEVARSRAYQVLYLETGCHPAFLAAQTLYGSVGFKLCGPFGPYRENGNSVFMSLALTQSGK